LTAGTPITASNSIVSVPIYDPLNPIASTGTSPVTIVGFLQVFINDVDQYGNVNVVVLNVAGCGNGSSTTSSNPVTGSSPVPIRLITPP
jgi:acyl CoA:acetate/3-ketoacid CoA transferase